MLKRETDENPLVPHQTLTKLVERTRERTGTTQVDVSAKNRLKKLRHSRQEGDLTGPEFEQRLRDR